MDNWQEGGIDKGRGRHTDRDNKIIDRTRNKKIMPTKIKKKRLET